jgi:HK97 family phage portal protein
MAFYSRWLSALAERIGKLWPVPGAVLVPDAANLGPDSALQLSTVWACIDRRASIIASLPFFAYEQQASGQKTLARGSRLFTLLHDAPNARMTPFEFWRSMIMNHDLRGNGYARIERDQRTGEAVSLWPMPADQVEPEVLQDGSIVYQYTVGSSVAVLAEQSVLHLKGLGNGTVGLGKLEFMRASTDEAARAQTSATKLWGTQGKPTGVLMLDHVLQPEQRKQLLARFGEMAQGNTARLFVLEANMKYQQLSLTPEQQQLLESRRFAVEELCRWFDVPPVLVHHSNVTTWGSGIEQIVSGFYKFTIAPMTVSIAQAVRRSVMTPKQRAAMVVEHNLDALLRADPAARSSYYASAVQNGYMRRNEVRQLENLTPDSSPMANELTVQSNLVPLSMLGKIPAQPTGTSNAPAQNPIAQ